MGWARLFLHVDVGQQLDLSDLDDSVARLRRENLRAVRQNLELRDRVHFLEHDNEQLKVCVAALIAVARRHNLLSQDEVERLTTHLDSEPEQSPFVIDDTEPT